MALVFIVYFIAKFSSFDSEGAAGQSVAVSNPHWQIPALLGAV